MHPKASVKLLLIVIILGFSIPFYLSDRPEVKTISSEITELKKNPEQTIDLIAMFRHKIPNLNHFESFLIKKYSHFPVARFLFDQKSEALEFIQSFSNKISRLEINKISFNNLQLKSRDKSYAIEATGEELRQATGATYFHNIGLDGTGVKIGIIDSGVSEHLDFGSRLKERASFVTIDNGYSQDISSVSDDYPSTGHGTQVAGIAAGSTTGIAPGAEIYSAKIIHDPTILGAGNSGGEETTSGILDAIDYLLNKSVDIINLSIGQYHNLADGMRDLVINYVSQAYDIIFTISAGNSGSGYNDRGTIHNPGTALQCISATASNLDGTSLASFASSGPKVDYSIKPDISAPGISIRGPSSDGSSFVAKSGTSMAAPVIAGGSALLIQFLKSKNLSYTAGTIKAALLAGANPMNLPVWKTGSGFVNLTKSLILLNSTNLVNNTPELTYIHPHVLPFNPYNVLFSGSTVEFNLTVISSLKNKVNILIPETLADFVSTPSNNVLINNTTLVPINFTIPAEIDQRHILNTIQIANNDLLIDFEIRTPFARILFDETFNSIVQHGYGTGMYETQGDTSNSICTFSEFVDFMASENNYSVSPHVRGEFTFSELSKYDVLVLANPFSLSSDVYMDWVPNAGSTYLSLSQNSINAILQFVDSGGGLLILSTLDNYYNRTAFNAFLENFYIEIQKDKTSLIEQCTIINPMNFTANIDSFPFRGNYLRLTASTNRSNVIASVDEKATLISYETLSGGRVIVFGSDLIFDNIAYSSFAYNGNPEDNKVLAYNTVAWLVAGEFHETTTQIPEYPASLITLVFLISFALLLTLYNKKIKSN
ncbi:MAG: S8 family peptidase [Candidatus Hodarchaeales archaeon]